MVGVAVLVEHGRLFRCRGIGGWRQYTLCRRKLRIIRINLKWLTPGGRAYMNEGMFDDLGWREDYYGASYGRLFKGDREKV